MSCGAKPNALQKLKQTFSTVIFINQIHKLVLKKKKEKKMTKATTGMLFTPITIYHSISNFEVSQKCV